MLSEQGPCERLREPERAGGSQREPERAREGQSEPDSKPERVRVSQRESERAMESHGESERAREIQKETERARYKLFLLHRAYIAGFPRLHLCIWEDGYKREAGPTSLA